MIKARGRDPEGNPVVLVGLTDENWERLRTGGSEGLGRPIVFDLRQLGLPPMKMVIMGGESEKSLTSLVTEFFMQIIEEPTFLYGENGSQ